MSIYVTLLNIAESDEYWCFLFYKLIREIYLKSPFPPPLNIGYLTWIMVKKLYKTATRGYKMLATLRNNDTGKILHKIHITDQFCKS